jgi:FtsZ-binding cell division protein ZapB
MSELPSRHPEALLEEIARLKAEVEELKEKMKTLPTRQINGKWYTEGQFQQLIQDARNWGL